MQRYIEYTRETVTEMARGLSSGTLASLTGLNRYDEVDPIRAEFIEFCEENQIRYETWQPAWNEFWSIKNR